MDLQKCDYFSDVNETTKRLAELISFRLYNSNPRVDLNVWLDAEGYLYKTYNLSSSRDFSKLSRLLHNDLEIEARRISEDKSINSDIENWVEGQKIIAKRLFLKRYAASELRYKRNILQEETNAIDNYLNLIDA